jgi:hypothetical protein
VTTQDAAGVEHRARKQAASIDARDDLAPVQVSGEDEVVAGVVDALPDSRVVSAQDTEVRVDRTRRVGA